MMPRVSVVIATFNRPTLLQLTLESIEQQTYRDFDVTVVDDASSLTGAEEVCRKYSWCRYIRQDHAGRSAARNRGIAASAGELIAFVDDDDLWEPEKLQIQVDVLDAHPNIGLVHCPAQLIDTNGRKTGAIVGANSPEKRAGDVFRFALEKCVVKSPCPLVRRDVLERAGNFDGQLDIAEDMELWARLAYITEFGFIPTPLAMHRTHANTEPDPATYFRSLRHIAFTLQRFVRPEDRPFVRRVTAATYMYHVLRVTPHQSKWAHITHIAALSPRALFSMPFVRILIAFSGIR